MATFSASPIADPNVDPQLANTYNSVQRNSLLDVGLQQDLADRQTFRDNAPGLVAKDPTATGLAMGSNPQAAQAFLSSIPAMDQNTREQASNDIAASGSLANSVLAQPAEQRQAAWAAGRQSLIASGHKMVPPEQYPGDPAMQTMAGMALTAQQQFELTAARPTTGNQPLLASTPGGGYVGPGGAQAAPAAAQPGQPDPNAPVNPALAQSENPSGNPATINKQGYVGNYQFGVGRLSSLGMYQPGQGENVSGNTFNSPQSWTGQFNIPGFPNVKTLADFRASGAAQNAAYQVHANDINSAIQATPGAENFDRNGLLAVAHLGGVGGMQKFVASGGKFSPQDANGTSLAAYYKRFSGGPVQTAANTPAPQPGAAPTMNDASPAQPPVQGPVSGLQTALTNLRAQPPAAAAPGAQAPAAGPDTTVSVDAPEQAASLPAGTAYKLPDGTGGVAGQATPAAPAGPPPNALANLGQPTTPAPQPNALAQATPAPQPGAPNALSNVGQPQPGSQGAPAMPQQVGVPPPGFLPLRSPKTGAFAPAAQAGYILYRNDATGQVMAGREPGTAPALHFENVGGQLIGSDPNSGAIISRQDLGNTGRLSDAPDGNGGIIKYDPRGNPVVHTPSNTNQLLQMEDYKRDQTVAQSAAEELTQAKATDFAIREQRGITDGLTQTGAFGQRKATLASYLESTFSPDVAHAFEKSAGLDDASQSEQFAKTALAAAGQQENANVGARGGFGLTQMYTKANPGLGSQPGTIRDIQNLQAVSNLSQQDYLQGLIGHINQNSNALRSGGQYSPSTNFSQQWNSGNNPQVYVAAAEALNQKPFAKWSAGLSPQDQQKALSIAARANNTASYIGPNGPAALTPYGAPQAGAKPASTPASPAVGTVARGYRFNGGDPSSPASWSKAQ